MSSTVSDYVSVIYIAAYAAAWGGTFLYHWRRVSYFGPGCYILISYFIFAIISLYLYLNKQEYFLNIGWDQLYLFPFIYLFLTMLYTSSPILRYDYQQIHQITKPNTALLNTAMLVVAISSLVTTIMQWDIISSSIGMMMVGSDSLSELYFSKTDLFEMVVQNVNNSNFLFKIFFILYRYVRDFNILFFLYYLTLKDRNKYITILLGLGVFSEMLWALASGTRTNAVLPIFVIVITYLSLFKFYAERVKKVFTTTLLGVVVFFSILTVLLTISRFDSTDVGTQGSIINYAGQANLNFNNYALDDGGIRYGDRTMPFLKEMLGLETPPDREAFTLKYSHLTINDNYFSTYIGDFTIDFGPYWAIVIFLLFTTLFNFLLKIRNNDMTFDQLIVLYFIMVVCAKGAMYLFDFGGTGNYRIEGFIIMYLIFKLSGMQLNSIQIYGKRYSS